MSQSLYEQHVLRNYAPAPFTIVKGQGVRVWDDQGRQYLDFVQGIATNTLGHCHPVWVERVRRQAGELVHVSNLYRNDSQAQLAERICQYAGDGRVFFCNSGAEANEALIKLARLHGRELSGGIEGRRYKVVCAQNAFHGRTFGGMAATPQEKIQSGFRPMLDGFEFGEFNNLSSFEKLVDDKTAAVFIETIQGESGVLPATQEFVQGLRKLCDQRGVLLMLDEVQCGIGRTGKFFAFDHFGVKPDAIGMAKGLGGGFPIGSIWVGSRYADLFKPGMHGTTFGGTPLACTAALAVLDTLAAEKLMDQVNRLAPKLCNGIKALAERYPDKLKGIRGMGYHVAMVASDNVALVQALRANGLLTAPGGNNGVRLLPPLNVTEAEIDEALEIIAKTLG